MASSRTVTCLACLLLSLRVATETVTEDTEAPPGEVEPPACSGARLHVTMSPLVKDRAHRLAEVHWQHDGDGPPPHRAVIYELPVGQPDHETLAGVPLAWSAVLPGPSGRLLSNYSVGRALPAGWDDRYFPLKLPSADPGFCFTFRAALLDLGGHVLGTACLRIEPTWMGDLIAEGRHNLAVMEMMLPGTHNSGCYPRDKDDFDSHMVRYLLTQGLTLWEQLVMGGRYFDIRVGYYPQDMGDQQNETHPDHGQKFWVNHDMVRVQPLRPLLKDIRRFLERAPGEVVVLDFHRFPVGFGSAEDVLPSSEDAEEPHELLIAMIKNVLGDLMIPNDKRHALANLKELKECGKRVLVSYGDRSYQVKENEVLWKPIPQLWGNQQTLEGLYSYLDKQLEIMVDRNVEWFALMAELTPTMFDILLNMQRSSLRYMADQVNANITATAREHHWKKFANIIAVDFFEGTDLVAASIEANRFRSEDKARHPRNYAYKGAWRRV